MLSGLKQSYIQHHEARQSFLIRFQWLTLMVALGFIGAFVFTGSNVSAVSTLSFTLILIATIALRVRGYSFQSAIVLSIAFLVEPTMAIIFSRGIESPYLVWLVVPMFATTGLLGARRVL